MRLIVRDGAEPNGGGWLDFDLTDVLVVLGQEAENGLWLVHGLTYVSKDDQNIVVLESMARGERVRGLNLVAGLDQLTQVINGEFDVTRHGDRAPFVTIRAVDSSWWEVESDDPVLLAAVRRRFRVVEAAPSPTA